MNIWWMKEFMHDLNMCIQKYKQKIQDNYKRRKA